MITVTLRLNLDQILDVGVDGPVSLMGAGGDVHVGLDLGQALDVGVDGPVSLMGAGGDVHVGLDLGQVLTLLVLVLQGYTVGVVGVSLLC